MNAPPPPLVNDASPWIVGIMMMLYVGCLFMVVLQHRFAEWKARYMAIGLTAVVSLPFLIPGTIYYAAAGAAVMMVIVCVAKPRKDEDEG